MLARLLLLTLLTLALPTAAASPVHVVDLAQALADGTLALDGVAGNGSSTGAALDGYLVNTTEDIVFVDIRTAPVYLANANPARQSMTLARLYRYDRTYTTVGSRSFVHIEPASRLHVMFVAFCADFEKDNPEDDDTFTVAQAPTALAEVTARIAAYAREYPAEEIVTAAQAAIWLHLGNTMEAIQRRFVVGPAQAALARRLAAG